MVLVNSTTDTLKKPRLRERRGQTEPRLVIFYDIRPEKRSLCSFNPGACTGLVYLTLRTSVKVKVHTLDISPLRSESPPQKCSGMARLLKGFHSFTCTPTHSSAIGMSHICLCLPSHSWYSFTNPGGMEG